MARHLTYGYATRTRAKGVSSIACLAFVAVLGTAFWAGTVFIGHTLMELAAAAF